MLQISLESNHALLCDDLPIIKTSTNALSLAIKAANISPLLFPKPYLLPRECTKSLICIFHLPIIFLEG